MTTPTVIINGKYWDMDQLTTAQTTVKDGLLESIGLKDSEVGVAGKMPSIGAKKGRFPSPRANNPLRAAGASQPAMLS